MSAAEVTIIDYGVGNLGSLRNALARVGKTAEVTGDPSDIRTARRLILPGVGSFDHAVRRLSESGLSDEILAAAQERRIPVAGVCLGMQLIMDGSDEGELPGLGLIPGRAVRFPAEVDGSHLLIPHMGWTAATSAKPSRFAPSLDDGGRFYFVHSYAVMPTHDDDVLTWSEYGIRYASSVERDNVIGVQFHPEKSHRYGLTLLGEFASTEV